MRKRFSRYEETLIGLIDGLSLLILPSFTSSPPIAALHYDRRGEDVPIVTDEDAVAYLNSTQLRVLGWTALRAADLIDRDEGRAAA